MVLLLAVLIFPLAETAYSCADAIQLSIDLLVLQVDQPIILISFGIALPKAPFELIKTSVGSISFNIISTRFINIDDSINEILIVLFDVVLTIE
jgi:hypothetical protein